MTPIHDADGKLLDLPVHLQHQKTQAEIQLLQALIDEVNRLKDRVRMLEAIALPKNN